MQISSAVPVTGVWYWNSNLGGRKTSTNLVLRNTFSFLQNNSVNAPSKDAVHFCLNFNFLLASDDGVLYWSCEDRTWLLLQVFPNGLIVHQDEKTALCSHYRPHTVQTLCPGTEVTGMHDLVGLFYVCGGNSNSGPEDCKASIPTHWAISPAIAMFCIIITDSENLFCFLEPL